MSKHLNGWDLETLLTRKTRATSEEPLTDKVLKVLEEDFIVEKVKTDRYHFFKAFLVKKLGLADTRAFDFAEGVNQLHLALSRCDYENLDTLMTAYPGMADLVQDYARLEDLRILKNHKHEEYKS